MGARMIFPGVGKLGVWERKSPNGVPGIKSRWRSGDEASRSRRQVV